MRRALLRTRPSPPWVVSRAIVFLFTVALIGALPVVPERSLALFWYVLVPLLPATFLINVELWRNVCPLATLNTLTGTRIGSRGLSKDGARVAGVVAVLLLALLIPARRFLFNVDALALGGAVLGVGTLAVLGGIVFEMRGGFCSSICPLLPVERLYGQRPLLRVANARCTPCKTCSKVCLDLLPTQSAAVLAAGGDVARPWTRSAFGLFATAFPGFIVAYYLIPDTTLAGAGRVYALMALGAAVSWLVLATTFRLGGVSRTTGLVWCAALAAGLYYWFAPPGIAGQLGLSETFVWSARIAFLGLVAVWLFASQRHDRIQARRTNGRQ